jgi:hypothetical protein
VIHTLPFHSGNPTGFVIDRLEETIGTIETGEVSEEVNVI